MHMRIAEIAPPWIPVPPKGYGGIELVVDLLAHGFEAHGHDVTLAWWPFPVRTPSGPRPIARPTVDRLAGRGHRVLAAPGRP